MTKTVNRSFASDNNSGVHPEILAALTSANTGHAKAYGDDEWTKRALKSFRKAFRHESLEAFFVFNGTAANVLSLKALTQPFHSVICAEGAHIAVDECGAPERFTGCKLLTVSTPDGKLTPELVRPHLKGFGDQHHSQPRVIAITQATELGTVYTPSEVRALADLAHANQMYLHMDGARISNAAVSLGVDFATITWEAGVDVLSFGGTKNGLLGCEAVVFFDPSLAQNFLFTRKQGMQLASKHRYLAAQFEHFLDSGLWRKNAEHSNNMARLLADEVSQLSKLKLTQEVQANGLFVQVPRAAIKNLQSEFFFYVWDEAKSVVRWMTSFDTTEADIKAFVEALRKV